MRFLTADVIFPVHSDPIPEGVLVLDDDGRILDILGPDGIDRSKEEVEIYQGFLTPGFINAHCHLELSWAMGKIPPGAGLDGFIRELELNRKSLEQGQQMEALVSAGDAMHASGTVAVGDISNTPLSAPYKQQSAVIFHTFSEVFASDPLIAQLAIKKGLEVLSTFTSLHHNHRASLTPHATYSVSAELLDLIRLHQGANPEGLISIHHQESVHENTFFLKGTGPIAERRNSFNPGIAAFIPTGKSPLQSIAPGLGRESHLLLVHNTFSSSEDIEFAGQYFRQVSWCLCPNANLFIENTMPPVELLRGKGVRVLLGTDSLASNHTLSLLEEMKTIHLRFPWIAFKEVLRWATVNAAESFKFEGLGTFSKGNKPGVVLIEQVDIPGQALLPQTTSRLLQAAGR